MASACELDTQPDHPLALFYLTQEQELRTRARADCAVAAVSEKGLQPGRALALFVLGACAEARGACHRAQCPEHQMWKRAAAGPGIGAG